MKNVWDIDNKNERVVAYIPRMDSSQIKEIHRVMEDVSPNKLIIYTFQEYEDKLHSLDFRLEATMTGFFQGETAYIYTRYFDEERSKSKTAQKNEEILQLVQQDKKDQTQIEITYHIERVKDEDLKTLTELFKEVFPVYPTNIFDVNYLLKSKEQEYLYLVAKNKHGRIIASASAMRTPYKSAEITDCAVHPQFRGQGILQQLIIKLEEELIKEGIYNSFSITRANSVGMNMTVKRLGYKYEGTLINNCIISTGFEDMNVWTKKLQ